MKNTNLTRAAASLLACGMVFGLTACGSSAKQPPRAQLPAKLPVKALFLTTLPQKAPPMIILIWLIFLSVMPMTRTAT